MSWERKLPTGLGGQIAAKMRETGSNLPKEISGALKRARQMSQGDRISWADASLSSIGRNLIDHGRDASKTGDYLRAAKDDAAALYACLTAAVDDLPPPPQIMHWPGSQEGVASVRQG